MAKGPKLQSFSRVAAPAQGLAQRFGLIVLLTAAILLVIFGKTHGDSIRNFRVAAVEYIAPVLEVLGTPVTSIRHGLTKIQSILHTSENNLVLREKVKRLSKWQFIARNLENENANLRALLKPAQDVAIQFVSARVISDTSGLFVKSVILNSGGLNGVERGQAVTNGQGLAGRILETGERSARLLLLTDLNSRVPVTLESTRYRAVLAGNNSTHPRLTFLPTNAKVNSGDRIVTSGHAGIFPPGLPVGVVSSIKDGEVLVQPFVDWPRLEYVTILRYRPIPLDDIKRRADRTEYPAASTVFDNNWPTPGADP